MPRKPKTDPATILQLANDPVLFQESRLKRKLWQKQKDIAYSVMNNSQTVVKGSHACGKTYLASGLPLFWLTRYTDGKVFNTAPTLRQVKLMWEEVSLARRDAGDFMAWMPEPTTTGLKIDEGRYGLGASSSRGVNLSGFHGGHVLIIADECPGIEADIWAAIEGIRSGGQVRILKLGNPIVPVGDFFDSFHRSRSAHNCISISAFDTPNFMDETVPADQPPRAITIEQLLEMSDARLDYAPYPTLIQRRWVKERYTAWGPDHPAYVSRVLAQFPKQAADAVFRLEWIERAGREPPEDAIKRANGMPIQIGIDVAGEGEDETTLTARTWGGIVIMQKAWADVDPRASVLQAIGDLIYARDLPYGVRPGGIGAVVVDTVGIGYFFARYLSDNGLPVFGFKANAAPVNYTEYYNQKAEAAFRTREYFQSGNIYGLTDLECQAQLSTMLFRPVGKGQTEIVPKDEMRKKYGVGRSPDRAESLIMAFARVIPQHVEVERYDHRVRISPV